MGWEEEGRHVETSLEASKPGMVGNGGVGAGHGDSAGSKFTQLTFPDRIRTNKAGGRSRKDLRAEE